MSIAEPIPRVPRHCCALCFCPAEFRLVSDDGDEWLVCEGHALPADARDLHAIGCAAVEAALFPDQQGA